MPVRTINTYTDSRICGVVKESSAYRKIAPPLLFLIVLTGGVSLINVGRHKTETLRTFGGHHAREATEVATGRSRKQLSHSHLLPEPALSNQGRRKDHR